jgi:hypothetical protein
MAQRRPTTAPPITAATTFYINISIAVKFTLYLTNITWQWFPTLKKTVVFILAAMSTSLNRHLPCEISGSHGSKYEDGCLLSCCTV